jgi:hypothetical protein
MLQTYFSLVFFFAFGASIQQFILHSWVSDEYEYSSSTNTGSSDDSKNRNGDFLANGCTGFDSIIVVYGYCVLKYNCICGMF